MIDIQTEKPLSLAEAARTLPPIDGRRPHTSTLWRWCREGVRARNGERVRLEHGRLGRRVVTTAAALSRFAARLAEADNAEPVERAVVVAVRARTPTQRQRDIEQAERELTELGI